MFLYDFMKGLRDRAFIYMNKNLEYVYKTFLNKYEYSFSSPLCTRSETIWDICFQTIWKYESLFLKQYVLLFFKQITKWTLIFETKPILKWTLIFETKRPRISLADFWNKTPQIWWRNFWNKSVEFLSANFWNKSEIILLPNFSNKTENFLLRNFSNKTHPLYCWLIFETNPNFSNKSKFHFSIFETKPLPYICTCVAIIFQTNRKIFCDPNFWNKIL